MRRIVGCLVTLAFLFAENASANQLVNGSFELGTPTTTFTTLPLNSTAITGWVVTNTDVDIVGTFWVSQNGARSVDLQGLSPGCISQTFASQPGASYSVSFWLAGNPACGTAVKNMSVSAAGQSANFSFTITGRTVLAMGWTLKTWSFVANAASTTITFCDLAATGSCGAAIDNVVVDLLTPTLHRSWGQVKQIYR